MTNHQSRELIIKDGLPLKQIISVTSNKESDKYNTTYEDHNRRISLLISRMNGVIISSSGLFLVCYTAVFSVVTRGALRDDTKKGCVAD